MAHQFSSGAFFNAQPAWHGLGHVVDGTLPAREAFELGGALFRVEPRPVYTAGAEEVPGYRAICRTDTGAALSIMRSTYQPVQNDQLLRVAEALREDLEMDAVCVLAEGRKVTFTASIRGAEGEVTRGDAVRQYLVGATSHDGTVAFQVLFTPVRVVCANTLAAALGGVGESNVRRIRHTRNAEQLIAKLPDIIDVQRGAFTAGLDELAAMAATPCTDALFRDYVAGVFADQLTGKINDTRGDASTARERTVEDLPCWADLVAKWEGALVGGDLPGVRGTYWGAYNAITEFCSHDAGRSRDPVESARQRLEALWFGKGAETVDRAHSLALAATRGA
jgi:phage/plasmid-like protein (TIGR03299 family)